MTSDRVLELLRILRSSGVSATLDGGWGVDALLGRQTRPHDDLDLVVSLGDVARIREALRPYGFELHEDHLPVRLVLRSADEQLDFHTVSFDSEGGGVQLQPSGGSFRYPPDGFVSGRVGGVAVPCVSAPVQILCHLGYPPTAKDAHDVLALCRAFALPVPGAYAGAARKGAGVNAIPDEYRDLLDRPIVVSMATLMGDGTPQVQPVWCSFDGTYVLVNTEKGRQKYRNLSRRRTATILAVDPDDDTRWLEVRGAVVGETEEGAREHIDELARLYLGVEKYPFHQEGDVRVLFRIAPRRVATMQSSMPGFGTST